MKSILLISAMSVTAATVLSIALLLVAGLIGYLTAWYYARSVYTPVIKGLEDDKAQLNREISGLKEDIRKLNGKIENLNSKIEGLEKEVAEIEKVVAEKETIIMELTKKVKA